MDTQRQWKVALEWIQKNTTLPSAAELGSNLLLALAVFSWSRGASYTADIVPLFSSSSKGAYLNTFHLDHMINWTRDQYQKKYGPDAARHIFTTVNQFGAIPTFYGRVSVKKKGPFWNILKETENRVILGEVDSICGIINLNQNHWVSVVIDFQRRQILYGDSFGDPMPGRLHKSFECWVNHLFN